MDKSIKILCTICARANSEGVPRKNIKELSGKPLIVHTIEKAKKIDRFTNIVVSTDSDEIAQISMRAGAEVPFMRPPELATSKIAKFPALRHALEASEDVYDISYDYIVDLDPTSPLRSLQDIDSCIDLVQKKNVQNVITAMESRKSPYFNLIEKDTNGKIHISKSINPQPTCRQDSPDCYDMNASIYAWKRSALMKNEIPIFLENTELYVMPENRSIDIDSELDFKFVEYVLSTNSK